MAIPRIERFNYLGSIIQEKGDIEEYINLHIKVVDKNGRTLRSRDGNGEGTGHV